MILLDGVSVQDRDLLARLTQYFAALDARIQEGQGWLIFNANRDRAGRITKFVLDRLGERRPFVSYYFVPWRDFALNAYMTKVELPASSPPPTPEPAGGPPDRATSEYALAGRVSRDQFFNMRFVDVLVMTGLRPSHRHELEHLDAVFAERFSRRLPTIVLTPHAPHQLHQAYAAHPGGDAHWSRLYDGMYATSLIAL
jgi:hypothetical protein